MQTQSNKILSDVAVFTKYARYIPHLKRRETWDEIVDRNKLMHLEKYPYLMGTINTVYEDFVRAKKVLPSMRSMQFAGPAIERNPSRIYNCAYLPIDHPDAFSEIMFLLLGGTGVGYSVQYRHVEQLPDVHGPSDQERRYVIGDSIEGWADAVKVLMESYFYGKERVRFDYRDIREKGTPLKTSGGRAPGSDPLRISLNKIESILRANTGFALDPIDAHDICCHLADAVLAGGIRRAAMISLFSADDIDMLTCKSGDWWELNPQRGRANNSVILDRKSTTYEEFKEIWKRVELSGAGEPGIYWTNNMDWGTNPCCEIALKPFQFCNLTEVNVSDVDTQDELNLRVWAATILGTLQAGYTDFHYLRPIWRKTTEEDALIGVGMTGIASGKVLKLDLRCAAEIAKVTNKFIAEKIGINDAARTTTIKPSGTSSIVLGSSSGIHAWHSPHYIRRMRVGKNEAIYSYLSNKLPELVEDDYFNPRNQAVISVPQEAPNGSIFRTESSLDLLARAIRFNEEWVRAGHNSGDNANNVSCTLSIKPEEWELIGDKLWGYRDLYNGMSVLPYDGGTYIQAPFEECTKEKFEEMSKHLGDINLSEVVEEYDNTDLTGEAACAGGKCDTI